MAAARKLDPSVDPAVARRRAMLLALPVADEPPTPEEDAIWDDIELELRSGVGGHTTEEMLARVDQMRRDASE